MSEREKQILKTIIEGIPKMSEFEKGYFLGIVEARAMEKDNKKKAGE